ncbi:uncharacterized protein LOC110987583 isoform X2 [Acanthaster planci]|nr:uncharacterized protein LOC110987583 isoform X2 [Acanthaster planci]XP_022106139.1 uncharacterized protein LOC110987583 isoform X2 [Acanthaster planci]
MSQTSNISQQVWKKRRVMSHLEVVEQPKSLGLHFIERGEKPPLNAYILGEKSTCEKTTYPRLMLMDYTGLAQIVWYLVADDSRHPHPYILEGEGCKDGVCTKTILAEGQIISFPGLYVRSVSRTDIKKTLEMRINTLREYLPGIEFRSKDTTEYNLNCVRICFQVLCQGQEEHHGNMSLLTRSLHSKEPSLQREPRILSISQCKGSVQGQEELTLQVTNLKTDDVFVFFHCESLEPRSSWQAFANVISISRQKSKPVDIVVETPPYPDKKITEPKTVAVQIRLMDSSVSNTIKFTYTPKPKGVTKIDQKYKLKEPIYVRYFTCPDVSTDVKPILKMAVDGKDTENSVCDPVYVYKREPRTLKKAKPEKGDAACQTEERYLRTDLGLEGYDSEEEIGIADDRVDYNRLERYRSLMMESESPANTSLTNGTERLVQTGAGLSQHDFTPKGVLGSLLSSKSNHSASSVRNQVGVHTSSRGNSSAFEKLTRVLSEVNLDSQSRCEGESCSHSESLEKSVGNCSFSSDKDIKDNQEESPPTDNQVVDAFINSTTNCLFGRFQCVFLIETTPKVQEIVLRPPGAANVPDLTGSSLYIALADKTKFPINMNPEGLVAVKDIEESQFQEEAYFDWHRLKQKNLINIIGLVKLKAVHSVILELPEEGCLVGYISRTDPAILKGSALKWIEQISKALQQLHDSGLAHQEIRLENCLISGGNDLILNIPSNLMMDGTQMEVGSAKMQDVHSFGVLGLNLLKYCGVMEDISSCLEFFQDDKMTKALTIQAVVKKLQCFSQQPSKMVPSFEVDPSSPTHELSNQNANFDFDPESYSLSLTPDSGLVCPHEIKHPAVSSLTRAERTYSSSSRESAFSDASLKSDDSLNSVRANSVVTSQGETAAATPTSSQEGDTPDGHGSSPPQEPEESEMGDEGDGRSGEDGKEESNGQDWDHYQNDKQDDSFRSHLRPPRVMKCVDHTGGILELFDGEVCLEIPPGALRDGQVEEITLSVVWNDKHIPPLKLTDMNAAPIVQCGPNGLRFEKPVLLKLPHCAVVPDPKQCKMTVHYSETGEDQGELPHWERISKPEDSNMAVEYHDRYFTLSVSHFCEFTVTIDGSGEESLAKNIMIVGYGPKLKSFDEDQQIRVYLYEDNEIIRERIHQEEQNLGGNQLDGPVKYQFHKLHRGSMIIEVKFHTASWLLTSARQRVEFSFSYMWNTKPWNRCKFTFSNSTNKATQFRCDIEAKQKDNDDIAQIEISNHVKISSEASCPEARGSARCDDKASFDAPTWPCGTTHISYRESQMYRRDLSYEGSGFGVPLCGSSLQTQSSGLGLKSAEEFGAFSLTSICSETLSKPLIPFEVERDLCVLLDPEGPAGIGNNWKLLASLFGINNNYIKLWESKRSPTSQVLSVIQHERKIQSLADLKEKLTEMRRLDAAKVIEDYEVQMCNRSTRSMQPTSEEPMALSNTPSPDETKPALTGNREFFTQPPSTFPDQKSIESSSSSSSAMVSGSSNQNMIQLAGSDTDMTGQGLSSSYAQHHSTRQELTPHPETVHSSPQNDFLSSPRNSMGTPDSCLERSDNTPWKAPTQRLADENSNMEFLKDAVKRNLHL